jgi:hypothetical protein
MGGFREWWDKMMGKGGEQYKEETGMSQPSEDELDQYHETKADSYVEQRDPGLMNMGQDDH